MYATVNQITDRSWNDKSATQQSYFRTASPTKQFFEKNDQLSDKKR